MKRFDTDTFLQVVENAVRGTKTEYDRDDDEDAHCIKCFDYVATTARYWQSKASSTTWNAAFNNRIKRAVCVSFPTLNEDEKETLRGSSGRCMACGRNEETNFTAISFFGSKPTRCFQNIDKLSEEYDRLESGINDVFEFADNVADIKKWSGKERLFHSDGGTFIVGETCLTRAKLAHMAGNFVSEFCYSVSVHMNDMQHNKQTISDKLFYCCGDEDVKLFNDSWDAMNRLCAKEIGPIDEYMVPIDQQYWNAVRKIRSCAFHGDRICLLKALSSRAMDDSHDFMCDEAWNENVCGDESFNRSVASKGPCFGKRPRNVVVLTDGSEEETEESEDEVIINPPKRLISVAGPSRNDQKAQRKSVVRQTPKASKSSLPVGPPDSRNEIVTGLLEVKDFLKLHGKSAMAVCVMEAVMALQK